MQRGRLRAPSTHDRTPGSQLRKELVRRQDQRLAGHVERVSARPPTLSLHKRDLPQVKATPVVLSSLYSKARGRRGHSKAAASWPLPVDRHLVGRARLLVKGVDRTAYPVLSCPDVLYDSRRTSLPGPQPPPPSTSALPAQPGVQVSAHKHLPFPPPCAQPAQTRNAAVCALPGAGVAGAPL